MPSVKIKTPVIDSDEVVVAKAVPRPRKTHKRQPEQVMARIMTAAINAFTKDGYKGARLRSIATEAGITIQLLVYHVKTKTQLWQMVMEHILAQYTHVETQIEILPETASAGEKLRHVITEMITYMATHPALHRIMTQEGARPSPRLAWLSERLVRPDLEKFVELATLAQKEGAVRADIEPLRLRYAVVAMGSVPFSVAAEYEYFAGVSPFSHGEVQKTIDMVLKLVFAGE